MKQLEGITTIHRPFSLAREKSSMISWQQNVPILLLGALLHRFTEVSVPIVGGCQIGERSVDFHLKAIELFGGKVEATERGFVASRTAPLKGAHIELPFPSVGAKARPH